MSCGEKWCAKERRESQEMALQAGVTSSKVLILVGAGFLFLSFSFIFSGSLVFIIIVFDKFQIFQFYVGTFFFFLFNESFFLLDY